MAENNNPKLSLGEEAQYFSPYVQSAVRQQYERFAHKVTTEEQNSQRAAEVVDRRLRELEQQSAAQAATIGEEKAKTSAQGATIVEQGRKITTQEGTIATQGDRITALEAANEDLSEQMQVSQVRISGLTHENEILSPIVRAMHTRELCSFLRKRLQRGSGCELWYLFDAFTRGHLSEREHRFVVREVRDFLQRLIASGIYQSDDEDSFLDALALLIESLRTLIRFENGVVHSTEDISLQFLVDPSAESLLPGANQQGITFYITLVEYIFAKLLI
jgi:hypothetical protein